MHSARSVVWLADVDTASEDFGIYSKQIAGMLQAKFPLVPGFVITPHAYNTFLQENHLDHKIQQLLSTVSFERPDSLMQIEYHIKQLFRHALFSNELYDEIAAFYFDLGGEVTLEMHETGTYGRKHTKKIVTSEEAVLHEVINIWSVMFTGNALWHRYHRKIGHFDNKAEIIVRKNIVGDATGRIFTIDPDTHEKNKLVITTEHPHELDTYILSKKNLTILDRHLKHKNTVDKLTLDEILTIAKLAKRLDEYLYFPQEISWILADGALYIHTVTPVTDLPKTVPGKKAKVPIARGKGVTPVIGTGIIKIVTKMDNFPNFTSHEILVLPVLNPQQLKKIQKVRGIILETHPHHATVTLLRHLGIPTICNVKNATKQFCNGHIITVHGGNGEIYRGGMFN